jgi:hypothetical protein
MEPHRVRAIDVPLRVKSAILTVRSALPVLPHKANITQGRPAGLKVPTADVARSIEPTPVGSSLN